MSQVARAAVLLVGMTASAGCSSGSSGSSGSGGTTLGDGSSGEAQATELGPAADATLPVGVGGPLSGTQTCTVGYLGEATQQTATPVTVSAAQVTQTSTTFTVTGLTIGPFAGASCTAQTIVAAVQVGSVAGATELGPNDADGGVLATTCTPSGTDLGALTVAVESGYFNPTVEQDKTALYLFVDITPAADGGGSFSDDDAALGQIRCAFTLMLN
jgi:hypothetical protein